MMERINQLRAAWTASRDLDPSLPLWVFGSGGIVLVAGVLLGVFLFHSPILWSVTGLVAGIAVGLTVFGRRATSAQIGAIEGQPGAAAAVLNTLRGAWFVTPAISVTRKQDLVHRVVGRPGVVLVGEGSPARVKQLLAAEKKKVSRAVGDVPVHTVSVGDGSGQVPLKELQLHVSKLSRELKKKDVAPLERKLEPLDKSNIPMPKGPMPRASKKMR